MFRTRENIIGFFEKGIFLFKGNVFKTKEETKEDETEGLISNGIALIEKESKEINNDLFKKYFDFSTPVALTKKLSEIKDVKENRKFVKEFKNRIQ